jgi:hypothetical protein
VRARQRNSNFVRGPCLSARGGGYYRCSFGNFSCPSSVVVGAPGPSGFGAPYARPFFGSPSKKVRSPRSGNSTLAAIIFFHRHCTPRPRGHCIELLQSEAVRLVPHAVAETASHPDWAGRCGCRFCTGSQPRLSTLPVSEHVTDCCNDSPSHGKQTDNHYR